MKAKKKSKAPSRKRRTLSPSQRLLDIFTRHLKKLPADEAEKRIAKLDRALNDDIVSNDRAKPQGQDCSRLIPFAARQR